MFCGRSSDCGSGSVVGSIDVVFHNSLVRLDGDFDAVALIFKVTLEENLVRPIVGSLLAETAAVYVTGKSASHFQDLAGDIGGKGKRIRDFE